MRSLEKLRPLALLLLRVALGVIFIYHGYPKLFGHTRQTMYAFAHMGFSPYFAYLAGVIEFFGGCLLDRGAVHANRGATDRGGDGRGARSGPQDSRRPARRAQLRVSAGPRRVGVCAHCARRRADILRSRALPRRALSLFRAAQGPKPKLIRARHAIGLRSSAPSSAPSRRGGVTTVTGGACGSTNHATK